jgi:hypothetical protein
VIDRLIDRSIDRQAKLGARGALVVGLAAASVQRLIWAVASAPWAMGAALVVGSPGLTSDAFMRQLATEYYEAPATLKTDADSSSSSSSGSDKASSSSSSSSTSSSSAPPPPPSPPPPPQGEIAAALTAVSTLAVLLSSKVIGGLFSAGSDRGYPGLPFAFGAACCIASLILLLSAIPPPKVDSAKKTA